MTYKNYPLQRALTINDEDTDISYHKSEISNNAELPLGGYISVISGYEVYNVMGGQKKYPINESIGICMLDKKHHTLYLCCPYKINTGSFSWASHYFSIISYIDIRPADYNEICIWKKYIDELYPIDDKADIMKIPYVKNLMNDGYTIINSL